MIYERGGGEVAMSVNQIQRNQTNNMINDADDLFGGMLYLCDDRPFFPFTFLILQKLGVASNPTPQMDFFFVTV